jgi:peptidoglycan hydrolase CwlO-like protein
MADPTIMSQIDWSSVGTAILTAGSAVGATLFALRRRASRDTVEIVKDRAEESIISHLEKQRDRAVEDASKAQVKLLICETEKNDSIHKVTTLTNEMYNLTSQVRILKDLVERLGKNLDDTRAELQGYMTENARLLAKIEILEERVKQHDNK